MNVISLDTETELIRPGRLAPPLVCLTVADEEDCTLFHHTEARAEVEVLLESDALLVGDNVAYDFSVICAKWPDLMPLVFEVYEADRVSDTEIREKLVHIAVGKYRGFRMVDGKPEKLNYSLADLVWRHLGIRLEKGTWQLRFGELIDVPLDEWPEEAREYALGDAVATLEVWKSQQQDARFLEDEFRQSRAAWWLQLMSCWGMRTDPEGVRDFARRTQQKYDAIAEGLREAGLLRADGTRNVKAVQERVVGAYVNKALGGSKYSFKGQVVLKKAPTKKTSRFAELDLDLDEMKVEDSTEMRFDIEGEKNVETKLVVEDKKVKMIIFVDGKRSSTFIEMTPKCRPKTDADVCERSGDPVLEKYADLSSLKKTLSTDIPLLEQAVSVPLKVRFESLLATGRTASTPNCFDAKTEILTRTGWKVFSELKDEEEVAQWDQGVVEFVKPLERFCTQAEELVSIKLTQVDLAITPDHRCLLQHRKTGEMRVFQAKEYPEDWRQLHAGEFAGGTFSLPEAFIGLLVATQADGSWGNGGIDFCFTKERKVQRLVAFLTELDVKHSCTQRKDRWAIRMFKGDEVTENVKDLLGPEKKFGSWVLDLDREGLDFFGNEVFFWDGCWTRKNHYASKIKENADWVQAALSLSGKRARLRKYVNNVGSVSWQVDITLRDYSLTTNRELKTERGNFEVFCVSVPSSYLLVRRNGCVVVTGNCQNLPTDVGVRECFTPRPGYVYASADYSQFELRTWAQVCLTCLGISKMADALNGGNDPHLELARRILGISYEEAKRDYEADPKGRVYKPRQASKSANFGFPGGLGIARFMDYARKNYGVELTEEKATELKRFWLDSWPEAKLYFDWVGRQCDVPVPVMKQLFVGRFRGDVKFTEMANGFFQSLAADAAKAAGFLVAKACYIDTTSPLFGCRPVNFIHDEVLVEVPDDERAHDAAVELARLMVVGASPFLPDVPPVAEPMLGRKWSKAAKAVRGPDGRLVPWDFPQKGRAA